MLIREYVVLDVFTDVPLQGNQLAVFTDGSALGGHVMQRAARELSLSETVFVLAPGDGADNAGVPGARAAARLPGAGADARIRIFTPAIELPFAGHPVLGAAFVVGESTGSSVVRLQTGAGVIPVELTREDGRIVAGEMEQPIPEPEPFANGDRLLGDRAPPGRGDRPAVAATCACRRLARAHRADRRWGIGGARCARRVSAGVTGPLG